jgi:predicted nucleic acid-binding protein
MSNRPIIIKLLSISTNLLMRIAFLSLTIYELHYSIAHAEGTDIAEGIIETKLAICAVFPIVPLTEEGAKIVGELKSKYQKHFGLKKKALSLS